MDGERNGKSPRYFVLMQWSLLLRGGRNIWHELMRCREGRLAGSAANANLLLAMRWEHAINTAIFS